jgi:hypothetical protein
VCPELDFALRFISSIEEASCPHAMSKIVGHRHIRVRERLHAPLVNYLILQSAIITASEVITGKTSPNGPRKLGDTIKAISYISNMEFEMPLFGPLEDALAQRPPVDFIMEFGPTKLTPADINDFVNLPSFYGPMIAPIFVLHFESCRDWLSSNGHADTSNWPMNLEFARHVRNATAHGGRLNMQLTKKAKKAPRPVKWHSLSYSISDNGRQILGTDIHGPDLIALMFDVDDETVALGAPR